MPQGKMKVKAKVPSGVKIKNKKIGKGGPSCTKRHNKPLQQKKIGEVQKVKRTMIKNVNLIAEEELRQKALEGRKSLKRSGQNLEDNPSPSKKKKK